MQSLQRVDYFENQEGMEGKLKIQRLQNMDPDYCALAEKIVKDMDLNLKKYPNISSFEIIPIENNFENKSPVIYLENCLGLEKWCVKYVYLYCYNNLLENGFSKSKRKSAFASLDTDQLIMQLNLVLMINPEISTFWNKKRELVVLEKLDILNELRLTRLILSRKAKSNETFAYRRWLLDLLLRDESPASFYFLERLIRQDFEITNKASESCPNNYHSWNHRIWFVNKISNFPHVNKEDVYKNEYIYSEKWCSTHVSDHSCFHYRQFCIKNLIKVTCLSDFEQKNQINLKKTFLNMISEYIPYKIEVKLDNLDDLMLLNLILEPLQNICLCNSDIYHLKCFQILFRELSMNNELISFYKGHETLWYHRRFITHTIISTITDYYSLSKVKLCEECDVEAIQKQPKISSSDSVKNCLLYKILLKHESHFVENRSKDGEYCSDKHKKYLKFIQGLIL